MNELTPLQQAVLALEKARSKIESLQNTRVEPIAVVGIGCRFPGGADRPEAFWQLLEAGMDAATEIPRERWDIDRYYSSDPEAAGKMYTRHACFLREPADAFDAAFFGISPREAASMDPQQRLTLEVAWEALEHAGIAPDRLANTRTGVYMGIMNHDFLRLQVRRGAEGEADPYGATGSGLSFLADRVSYVLGLQGPSIVVATECSSSLVATHLACQALRADECDLALAGGVNLMLSPAVHILFCRMRAMAADGRCKTFDAAADGYGRGEGCGVLVLKRLSDALRDRDTILALVRGSAVNHDGPSSGLTVPNVLAQQKLIRQALAASRIDPLEVSYVEAHGTGTPLGDPLEIQALQEVLCAGRPSNQPLLVGTVKTNIGHLEAAAGVSSLIKVVLSLQKGRIPPHLHLRQPNPRVAWQEIPIHVPTELTPWPRVRDRRVAGVSSFGLSGIHAHVIVEEAPAIAAALRPEERPRHLLTLSAKSEMALEELTRRLLDSLAAGSSSDFADICYTASAGRAHFERRMTVLAQDATEAQSRLEALLADQKPPGAARGHAPRGREARIAFLFTGQGSQSAGMGKDLYETQPTFRKALDRCGELLRPHLSEPLIPLLFPSPGTPSRLDDTQFTQPALFALEFALWELWRSWGIQPAAVLGHSVGEYVAACAAGVFPLEDALGLIAARARLMQNLPRNGAMLAVMAGEEIVLKALRPFEREASIAAINAPRQIVVSGLKEAIDAIATELRRSGFRSIRLNVSHAFHSPLMAPVLDAFEKHCQNVRFSPPRLSLVSNLTGRFAGQEIAQAEYWRRHIREPVQFAQSIRTLEREGFQVFLEVGPHPVLLGLAQQAASGDGNLWLPSFRRGEPEWPPMLESLAALYRHGVPVDWQGFDADYSRRKVVIPTYPFQRQRFGAKPGEAESSAPALEN